MSAAQRGCEICKQAIDPERLEAIPETRLCTRHAQEIEKYGGEFRLSARQERTSKPGSLKRNYGSVSTRKIRNNLAVQRLRESYQAGLQGDA